MKPIDLEKIVDKTPRLTTEDIIDQAKHGDQLSFGACYPWSKKRPKSAHASIVQFNDLSSFYKKQGVKPYLVHKKLSKEWYETQRWA